MDEAAHFAQEGGRHENGRRVEGQDAHRPAQAIRKLLERGQSQRTEMQRARLQVIRGNVGKQGRDRIEGLRGLRITARLDALRQQGFRKRHAAPRKMRNGIGAARLEIFGPGQEGTLVERAGLDADAREIPAAPPKILQPLARIVLAHAPDEAGMRLPHAQSARGIQQTPAGRIEQGLAEGRKQVIARELADEDEGGLHAW